jgi:hypothetical protein
MAEIREKIKLIFWLYRFGASWPAVEIAEIRSFQQKSAQKLKSYQTNCLRVHQMTVTLQMLGLLSCLRFQNLVPRISSGNT